MFAERQWTPRVAAETDLFPLLGPNGELRVHISERLIATLIREYSIDPDRRKSIRAFPDGFPKTKTGG